MSLEQEPKNDAQDESTFSAASMFGMLLTLSTCLLLQPQGSLILKRPSKFLGRALFFFLRLNPYVCAVEGASVLHALVLILWRATKVCHGNLFKEFGVFNANLQAGAAGLLFLRSHTALRRWDTDPRLDELLVGPAPKCGHTEMVIDVVTLLSVMGAVVKLAASAIPWHFQIISWCYIGGWIVVQLAVMMSHYSPSRDPIDVNALLRSAEYLRRAVDDLESNVLAIMMMMALLAEYGAFFVDKFDALYCFLLMIPASQDFVSWGI